MMKRFQELAVWQKADELAHRVFDLTGVFPMEYRKELLQFINEEIQRMLNGLATSLRRSSASRRYHVLGKATVGLLLFFSLATGHWPLATGHVDVAFADVPPLIRYQGQAVDKKGVPLEGPYTLTFRFYNAETGGAKTWEEVQMNVPLTTGHFSILLGQVTSLASMDWSKPCWLSVQVNSEPELSPRQRITSVPMAIRAEVAETAQTAEQLTDTSVRVYHAGSTSIANNTETLVPFNAETWDTGTLHDPVTNNDRLVAPTAGKYLVWATIHFQANATGRRRVILSRSGVAFAITDLDATAAGETIITVSSVMQFAAGQYAHVSVFQNSGGALEIVASASTFPNAGMIKLAAE